MRKLVVFLVILTAWFYLDKVSDWAWSNLPLIFQDMFNPSTTVFRTSVGLGVGVIFGLAAGIEQALEDILTGKFWKPNYKLSVH